MGFVRRSHDGLEIAVISHSGLEIAGRSHCRLEIVGRSHGGFEIAGRSHGELGIVERRSLNLPDIVVERVDKFYVCLCVLCMWD